MHIDRVRYAGAATVFRRRLGPFRVLWWLLQRTCPFAPYRANVASASAEVQAAFGKSRRIPGRRQAGGDL